MLPVPAIVARADAVTTDWLTEVLRHSGALGPETKVASFDAAPVGTGQVGANVRFRLAYHGAPGPASVICKFASADPDSAAAGIRSRTYETEVAFYRDLAPTVAVSRPRCYFAGAQEGTANVVLVLEDLEPAQQGDQLAGCTIEQAELAVDQAAELHAPRWGDPRLRDLAWLVRERAGGLWEALPALWGGFVDRFRDALAPLTIQEGGRMLRNVQALQAKAALVPTVVHGDFRLDNLMFDPTGRARPITVVDWQTVRMGAGPEDVAYFLGNAFADPAERRAGEADLVRRYHDALLRAGVAGYSFEQCWQEYRRNGWSSLLMAVVASMHVGRTERGDRMFVAMADRSAQLAADLDTAGALARGCG